MFDILNNVTATKLPIINEVITYLNNKPDSYFNVNKKEFDLEKIQPINLTGCEELYKHRKNTKKNEYNQRFDELVEHIRDSDIPAFIYIMTLIQPKFLICFGGKSAEITNILINRCTINGKSMKDETGIIDVQQVLHYSSYGEYCSEQDKYDSFNKAMDRELHC
ncbi:hypothetical protein [Apilactobacillus micheneri]|uniref:hypothetical protein n=1 Tax=Apilactobacillus micheneri TaxID=1899430 RepID=UPI001125E4DB|nr:hypothetical protein [Apilactobacillus micheneri]TPR50770.1 hypothetical protein DY126_06895 [Apilactobacillus micheneri]